MIIRGLKEKIFLHAQIYYVLFITMNRGCVDGLRKKQRPI